MIGNEEKLIPFLGSILAFGIAFVCFKFPERLLKILNFLSKKKSETTNGEPKVLKVSDMKILGIMTVASGVFLITISIFVL